MKSLYLAFVGFFLNRNVVPTPEIEQAGRGHLLVWVKQELNSPLGLGTQLRADWSHVKKGTEKTHVREPILPPGASIPARRLAGRRPILAEHLVVRQKFLADYQGIPLAKTLDLKEIRRNPKGTDRIPVPRHLAG